MERHCTPRQYSVDTVQNSVLGNIKRFNTPPLPPPILQSLQLITTTTHLHIVKALLVSSHHTSLSLQTQIVKSITLMKSEAQNLVGCCLEPSSFLLSIYKAFQLPLPRSTITNALRIHPPPQPSLYIWWTTCRRGRWGEGI